MLETTAEFNQMLCILDDNPVLCFLGGKKDLTSFCDWILSTKDSRDVARQLTFHQLTLNPTSDPAFHSGHVVGQTQVLS